MSNIDDTLAERREQHGNFEDVAAFATVLKELLRDGRNWSTLSDTQREALDMKASKIARIMNGDPNNPDHWHDDAGYSILVEKHLTGEQIVTTVMKAS